LIDDKRIITPHMPIYPAIHAQVQTPTRFIFE